MMAGWVWLVAGVVVMALELLPGASPLWLGLAGVVTGLVALVTRIGIAADVGVFAFAAVILVALGVGLRRWRHPVPEGMPLAWLVGKQVRALGFDGDEGQVRVGESDWQARLLAGNAAPNARLTVVAVDGTTLLVCPEAQTAP